MTRTRSAVVIGGGIAGPAAAIALHRAGIEAVVYEARSRTDDGAGVFLTLATNGIDALRTIEARSVRWRPDSRHPQSSCAPEAASAWVTSGPTSRFATARPAIDWDTPVASVAAAAT